MKKVPQFKKLLILTHRSRRLDMKQLFNEQQISAILEGAESDMKVADHCRKHGISKATHYNWKAEFSDMTV